MFVEGGGGGGGDDCLQQMALLNSRNQFQTGGTELIALIQQFILVMGGDRNCWRRADWRLFVCIGVFRLLDAKR